MAIKLGAGFLDAYDWELHPKAEKFLMTVVQNFLRHHSFAKDLGKRMERETSTHLFDWIDHIVLPNDVFTSHNLHALDFKKVRKKAPVGHIVFQNPNSVLFPVLLGDEYEIALKAENINNVIKKLGKEGDVEGEKYSSYRKAEIRTENNYVLSVVQRRGSNEFIFKEDNDIKEYNKALL